MQIGSRCWVPGNEKRAGAADRIDIRKYHETQQTVDGNAAAVFAFKIKQRFAAITILIDTFVGIYIRVPAYTRRVKVRGVAVKYCLE